MRQEVIIQSEDSEKKVIRVEGLSLKLDIKNKSVKTNYQKY